MYTHNNEKTDSSSDEGSKAKGKAVIPQARRVDVLDHFNKCISKYAL